MAKVIALDQATRERLLRKRYLSDFDVFTQKMMLQICKKFGLSPEHLHERED